MRLIPPGGIIGLMIADIKKRALHPSRILEGQMRGLEKMIESEDYCMDIITQSLAIQKSLRSLNKLLVENHLRTPVSNMFANGEQDVAVETLAPGLEQLREAQRSVDRLDIDAEVRQVGQTAGQPR